MAARSGAPMRADARRNYERLLEEARQMFLAHGADVALEDIARHAGVGIGTLYRHFPDRNALMSAVYATGLDEVTAQAEKLMTADSPAEALGEWLRAVAVYTASYRGITLCLMAADDQMAAACRDALRAAGGALLERAQAAGEVREDAAIGDLLKLTHAVLLAAEKTPEDRELFGRLMTLVVDGLRTRNP